MTLEVEWGSLNNRGSYGYNMKGSQRYRRNNNMEEVIIGIKVMTGIGKDHMKGKVEMGKTIEA